MSSSNKIVLITGGSRGIGAATAMAAADLGYNVIVNYKANSEAAHQMVNTIRKQGKQAEAIQADISKEGDVVQLFRKVDAIGPVYALINNAATIDKQMSLVDMTAERIQRIFDTNVLGTFLSSREAVKRMSTVRGGGGGVIVNISSGAAQNGSPGDYIDYAASKGAIDTFTVGLAREVAKEGIRVNAIRPGFVDTDIHHESGVISKLDDIARQIPMGRIGKPEEIAQAILWLISDKSSFTTGAILNVTGGR